MSPITAHCDVCLTGLYHGHGRYTRAGVNASSDEDEGEDEEEEESLISLDSDSQSACVSQADVQQQRRVDV